MELAPAAVPVEVNVSGLPASVPAVAVSVLGPAIVPSVHDVAAAMPFASVVTGVAGLTEPPPDATVNVTETPATGLLNTSRTITVGGAATAVPTVADWPSPALIAMPLAGTAVPVAVKVTGLPASVPDVAVSVWGPAVVPSVQPPTVAMPAAFVVWVAPVTEPPPDVTANVTVTPPTGLLN